MMTAQQERRGLDNLVCYQGDSHRQATITHNKFDLIFGCNLIDRLNMHLDWIQQSMVRGNMKYSSNFIVKRKLYTKSGFNHSLTRGYHGLKWLEMD